MVVPEKLPVDLIHASSLLGQSVDDLIAMSHHAITSHVLDAFLISSKVAAKWKRKLLLAFDGRYLDLVCDKFGSRVGDTIWDRAADGFMKVRYVCLVTTLSYSQSELTVDVASTGEDREITFASRDCAQQQPIRSILLQATEPANV